MFTTGKIIFAIVFLLAFVAAMVWSFRQDKGNNTRHYKGSYKVLVFILLVFMLFFFIVKFRHLL